VRLASQPYLVGQFQPFPGAELRGVLVQTDELFAALVGSLPPGGVELIRSKPSASRYPASVERNGGLYRDLPPSLFPGLQLYIPRESGDVFNRSFWVVSGMMIVVMTLAFFFGGTLLVWLARRSALDAMQKTDFLSNISHELKTPLTTIRMYAELLEEGRVASEEKQRRYFHTIGNETQRLARLVNNILQFSALQKGKSRLRIRDLDIADLARSVCEGQEIRFKEAGMRLLPSFPEGVMEVAADPDAVEQGLINLFDNAIKYASKGEAVSCRLDRSGGLARLTVEDYGPGIPREQREKIFEAFHRVDDSLTSEQPGSGLGLSITQSLFRQMGGDLRYEPNEPNGSRFHLELPLK
jgi:signal transduction histidine kinase